MYPKRMCLFEGSAESKLPPPFSPPFLKKKYFVHHSKDLVDVVVSQRARKKPWLHSARCRFFFSPSVHRCPHDWLGGVSSLETWNGDDNALFFFPPSAQCVKFLKLRDNCRYILDRSLRGDNHFRQPALDVQASVGDGIPNAVLRQCALQCARYNVPPQVPMHLALIK